MTAADNLVRAFDRRTGNRRWQADVKTRPITGPVVVGSAVIVPGASARLRAWTASSGQPAGEMAFEEPVAVSPAFGDTGVVMLMAVVTGGGVGGKWTLSLMGPEIPTLAIVPLTGLPGVDVPIRPPGR